MPADIDAPKVIPARAAAVRRLNGLALAVFGCSKVALRPTSALRRVSGGALGDRSDIGFLGFWCAFTGNFAGPRQSPRVWNRGLWGHSPAIDVKIPANPFVWVP